MRIERIDVARVNPAPYNPRLDLKPGDPDYEKLRRSLDQFGLVEPLVWNRRTGNLVGGHQRFKLLLERGDKRVDVSVVDLPLEREKALNIALNKISGDWDARKLAELLDELIQVPDFDIAETGFDPPDADALIAEVLGRSSAGAGELTAESFDVTAEMEAAAEARGEPVTRPGEIIVLGEHRLLCGDCTDSKKVQELLDAMGGARARLFATDPPYLVNYDGTNHYTSNRKKTVGAASRRTSSSSRRGSLGTIRTRKGAKDWSGSYGISWDDADANSDLYQRFIRVAIDVAIDKGAPWYCWHASKRQAMLEAEWNKVGAFVHQQIIWAKNRPILTRSFYTWQHEPCLMGWVRGENGKSNQPKRMAGVPMLSSIWAVDVPGSGNGQATESAVRPDHPTPKPLELFEIPIRQHTRDGDVVYEPFCGSGTQLIAAERLKRRCMAVEISPHYCDVIVRRWLAYIAARDGRICPTMQKLARRYAAPAAPPSAHRLARRLAPRAASPSQVLPKPESQAERKPLRAKPSNSRSRQPKARPSKFSRSCRGAAAIKQGRKR